MVSRTVDREALIFGKMPVIVRIAYGEDDSPVHGREYYEEVENIWWRLKSGKKAREFRSILLTN